MTAPVSSLRFACPVCGAILEAAINAVGAVVLCPYCNTSMAVPDATVAPVPPQPPLAADDQIPLLPPPAPKPQKKSSRKGEAKEDGSKYYIRRKEKQRGPFSSRQLRKLVRDGQLDPTDLIWRKGFKDWKPAAKARGLFPDPDRPPP
jgi:hypothetical protein